MGKLMVAQGLGVTVLPDYSIVGDPPERSGVITHRSLGGRVKIASESSGSTGFPARPRGCRGPLTRGTVRMESWPWVRTPRWPQVAR
ncbi:hypothetical protein KBI5_20590 [Frankia sp. KB5]|nr:hypothetical protein KBI5_20590 [Frankia sp. KB5]